MENLIQFDPSTHTLYCKGSWDISHLPELKNILSSIKLPQQKKLIINGEAISKMDTAGAWLLITWTNTLKEKNFSIQHDHFSKQNEILFSAIRSKLTDKKKTPVAYPLHWVTRLGKTTHQIVIGFREYLEFIGKLTYEVLRLIRHPSRIRFISFAAVIDKTGFQALFIVALLSFMIGVVIAYQMGLQLKNYGANIFIVDLLGLSILREFAPLMTAIIVAGRTGSSFTAQLGMMKINQEIDALNTMGVTPGELLLLPRIIGLTIALPLLTIWANIFGVIGGMTMANNMLGISWYDFLSRFERVIPLKTLIIGLGKAPIFALIIASIACFQGMQVAGSADSVGKNTTRSVVFSIFFIIVADAIFSILLSKLKL